MIGIESEVKRHGDQDQEEEYRHWSPGSQKYATVDVLQQYIYRGWHLENIAQVETFYCTGARAIEIYSFTLTRGTETMHMPVIATPIILRLITEHNVCVLRVKSEREPVQLH
jgi:hypothetical protein